MDGRSAVKQVLGRLGNLDRRRATGATLLTYHRVGGGTSDELDLPVNNFEAQLDLLVAERHDVVALDAALDRLDAGDPAPSVVLTFDDGFADVFDSAWPLLRERQLPFTVYLAAGLVDGEMRWEGSAAASQGASALTWQQLAEMHADGLCTVANHTWDHAGPDAVDQGQLDRCSSEITRRLGVRPQHFAWPWGAAVPELMPSVRERFRSAATGEIGRNGPEADRHALFRLPVRRSDPLPFFRGKLHGQLLPERVYASMVGAGKTLRRIARRE